MFTTTATPPTEKRMRLGTGAWRLRPGRLVCIANDQRNANERQLLAASRQSLHLRCVSTVQQTITIRPLIEMVASPRPSDAQPRFRLTADWLKRSVDRRCDRSAGIAGYQKDRSSDPEPARPRKRRVFRLIHYGRQRGRWIDILECRHAELLSSDAGQPPTRAAVALTRILRLD